MPTVRAYPLGLSVYVPSPPARPDAARGKRQAITGWSPGAASRHRAWLQSVDPAELDGHGYAVTLTLRDTPPDAVTWHAMRKAWWERMKRTGAVRWHWVVEWQRRGAPHLHAAVYWLEELTPAQVLRVKAAWQQIAQEFGVDLGAQKVEPITDAQGWAKYCAKHSARSGAHYQREGKGPEGWASTGRLWGHGGPWPVSEGRTFAVDVQGFHQMRRLVRSWRIADAHQEKDPAKRRARVVAARRMWQRSGPGASCWGAREWVPAHVAARMVAWLADQGYEVHDVTPDATAEATAGPLRDS